MRKRLLFVITLVGCGSGGSTTGDDGSPIDGPPMMGSDGPVDMPPQVCSPADPTSCSGETICIGTSCEAAFDRIYTFSQISVLVAANNQGGSDWDPLGGQPDPQVEVKLNGAVILTTGHKDNTFTASFTESTEKQIVAGSKLELNMTDDDGVGDDAIFSCTTDPLSAELLREAVITCNGSGTESGSQIVIHINAKG